MSLRLRFLFATYFYIDGAFCRFVGHVRNVNYQNATRNDRQMELVGDVWVSHVRREDYGVSEGTDEGGRDETTSENYESS